MKLNIPITIYISMIIVFCLMIMFMGAYLGIKDDFDNMQMAILYGFPSLVICSVLHIWTTTITTKEDEEAELDFWTRLYEEEEAAKREFIANPDSFPLNTGESEGY